MVSSLKPKTKFEELVDLFFKHNKDWKKGKGGRDGPYKIPEIKEGALGRRRRLIDPDQMAELIKMMTETYEQEYLYPSKATLDPNMQARGYLMKLVERFSAANVMAGGINPEIQLKSELFKLWNLYDARYSAVELRNLLTELAKKDAKNFEIEQGDNGQVKITDKTRGEPTDFTFLSGEGEKDVNVVKSSRSGAKPMAMADIAIDSESYVTRVESTLKTSFTEAKKIALGVNKSSDKASATEVRRGNIESTQSSQVVKPEEWNQKPLGNNKHSNNKFWTKSNKDKSSKDGSNNWLQKIIDAGPRTAAMAKDNKSQSSTGADHGSHPKPIDVNKAPKSSSTFLAGLMSKIFSRGKRKEYQILANESGQEGVNLR